jgi:phosphoglycolate phosphatase
MIIIFDFDGTLADSLSAMLRLYNEEVAPTRHLKEVTDTDWQKIRRMKVSEALRYVGIKPYQLPGLLTLGRRELLKHAGDIKLFPGIADVVRELAGQGHGLYLLSTNSQTVVQTVVNNHGIADYIQVLKSTAIFGKAQAVRHLMRKLKTNPAEVFMVGDEIRDIQAAHKVGVKIISVAWGMQPEDLLLSYKPDWLAKQPNDIVSFIDR